MRASKITKLSKTSTYELSQMLIIFTVIIANLLKAFKC